MMAIYINKYSRPVTILVEGELHTIPVGGKIKTAEELFYSFLVKEMPELIKQKKVKKSGTKT